MKVRILDFILVLLLIIPSAAVADGVVHSTSFSVEGAYYLDDNKGYGVGDGGFAPISYDPEGNTVFSSPPDNGRDLGSGWGSAEIQALLTHRIVLPFLEGTGALTSDNNLAFSFTGALTPVSVRFEALAALTPIAFVNVFAGTMVGTGWDLFGLFHGMALNADGSGIPKSDWGFVSKSRIGGTFQFDLAEVVPGEWTHVVVLVRPELQYAFFSGADRGEAWLWEADEGENFNGFMFLGTYFLGYQMPLRLDTVGLLIETEQNLGYVKDLSPMDSAGWGSDYVQITLSPLLNFMLSETSYLVVLFQLRRERLYDEPSIFANYYENRSAAGTYWDFYRIAFSYSLIL
ncbi:MAG: hypothetical protein JSV89_15660 [Spirochaetaceae bacterium]|nr:MAG: hypothetical protein JSV89_15660 [Spirochaetaceae bacterium]